jgi:thiosulfate/3-mercaptopyruvate sulfurtransferase
MEKIYGDIGITESTEVITYCHSGVRSAHTLFVLKELLGYGKVQNYDGSWTEWSHISYE